VISQFKPHLVLAAYAVINVVLTAVCMGGGKLGLYAMFGTFFFMSVMFPTPQLPVERAVLDRLGNVVAGNVFRAGQIGNRPRHLQNPVVGAGAQIQFAIAFFSIPSSRRRARRTLSILRLPMRALQVILGLCANRAC
jgi:hypothetical protein